MSRKFNVPSFYRSPTSITAVKKHRHGKDRRRKDLTPSIIDCGKVRFKIARHFGFCFGVENAIEIAYRAIDENPGKQIFLLSEMIHNPGVNKDLQERGVRFLMETDGTQKIPFSELSANDIVIVPAFGTTIELQKTLSDIGIDPYYYDTTCPFVEKVWKRASELGKQEFTVIVHGKHTHEETRATFSHSRKDAPTFVILDKDDAHFVAEFILEQRSEKEFMERFGNSISEGFDPKIHLTRVGVVNQTTMLATETTEIVAIIRKALVERYGPENIKNHFADTRDTLCYATYENQSATRALIEDGADLAIVVGGYNSSNTSHLVELCEETIPTYYIKDESEIEDTESISHFDLATKAVITSKNWLPKSKTPINIAITSGASCPDKTVDQVLYKIASLLNLTKEYENAFTAYTED
jgi:4-hydroxy-3-methylbut-2-enyl diphosphate reductase